MSPDFLATLTLRLPYSTLLVSEEDMDEQKVSALEQKVKEAIEAIRPSLQNDGGDIEFIKMDGKNVQVRLIGACAGCPMSEMTLKSGVERYLRNTVDKGIVIDNTFDM